VLLGAITDAVGILRYVVFRRSLLAGTPTPTRDVSVVLVAVAISVLGALLGALVVASVF
jgi:hypothetical protein